MMAPGCRWMTRTRSKHAFEVRACFQDALPAPYWRAYWGTLPDADAPGTDPKRRAAIRAFQGAGSPCSCGPTCRRGGRRCAGSRKASSSRTRRSSSRRWTSPRCPGSRSAFRTRRRRRWISCAWNSTSPPTTGWRPTCSPPAQRVPAGRTLPLRDVRATDENRLAAAIDLTGLSADRGRTGGAVQPGRRRVRPPQPLRRRPAARADPGPAPARRQHLPH